MPFYDTWADHRIGSSRGLARIDSDNSYRILIERHIVGAFDSPALALITDAARANCDIARDRRSIDLSWKLARIRNRRARRRCFRRGLQQKLSGSSRAPNGGLASIFLRLQPVDYSGQYVQHDVAFGTNKAAYVQATAYW
jgi:hypothetical protein